MENTLGAICTRTQYRDPISPATKLMWDERPLQFLVTYLRDTEHPMIRRGVERLHSLFLQSGEALGDNMGSLGSVWRFFQQLADSLLEHMAKEEQELFPQLIVPQGPRDIERLRAVLDELSYEHDSIGEDLVLLQLPVSRAFLPEEPSGTLAELRRELQEFEDLLRGHVALEKEVLFPRISASIAHTANN